MPKPLPMNEQKKSVIWQDWKQGTPMANIERVIDKPPATIFSYLQYHGVIRPRHRFRRALALSLEERCDGELLLFAENRKDQAKNLPDQETGARRRLRLHRAVLQSAAPALDHRVSKHYHIRGASYEGLSCRPQNRQQATR